MYQIVIPTQAKKDLKRIKKRNSKDFQLISKFLVLLSKEGVNGIPDKHIPHKLSGNYKGTWEAHIKPDLLIIWWQYDRDMNIEIVRIGSHSDLFK